MSVELPRADMGFKVRNTFKLTVRKADGRIVRESGPSGNIVVKGGLNRMLSAPSAFTCGAVCGEGNTPASINDNLLESFVAGTRIFDTGSPSATIEWAYKTDAPPIWCRQRRTWRFDQGQAEGNIAEVGLAMAGGVPIATDPLFSRALVVDSSGNPTVIPVQADEYLDVTYDYYVYPQFNDVGSMPFEILGVDEGRDYILRAASMTGAWAWGGVSVSGGTFNPFLPYTTGLGNSSIRCYSGPIGPVTGEPSNLISNIGEFSLEDYVEDSFQRDFSLTCGLGVGNHVNGLRSVVCAMRMGRFQIEYDPPIPKTDEHTLRLDFRASVGNL